jgi:hypothetical protein
MADTLSDGVNECVAQTDDAKVSVDTAEEIAPKKVCTPLCKILIGAGVVGVISLISFIIWQYVL